MIIAAVIIGIILIFLVALASHINNNEEGEFGVGLILGIVISVLLYAELSIIDCISSETYPTAMDVYQGKTTLEYKVVDGVKLDSVVIFKNDSTVLNFHEMNLKKYTKKYGKD